MNRNWLEIGDLVKMNRGYSIPGLLLELIDRDASWGPLDATIPTDGKWARVLWPDDGLSLEKVRDLVRV